VGIVGIMGTVGTVAKIGRVATVATVPIVGTVDTEEGYKTKNCINREAVKSVYPKISRIGRQMRKNNF